MKIYSIARKFLFKYADEFASLLMTEDEAASLLGVSKGCSLADLKKAYKQKVYEFHPDRNLEKNTTNELKRVNRAYEMLLSSSKDNKESFESRDSFDAILNSRPLYGTSSVRKGFNFGKYELSIQASHSHYCFPREDLDKLSNYRQFELAISDADGNLVAICEEGKPNTNPEIQKDFGDMPGKEYWASEGNVAGYVPRGVVKDLFNYMNKKFGLVNDLR